MSFKNTVTELTKKLSDTRDIVEKINQISAMFKEIVGADRCSIFVYDEDTKSFWSAYIDGVSYIEIPSDQGLVGKVFAEKKPSIYNFVKNEQEHLSNIDEGVGYQTKSMLTAPILNYKNDALGVIQILNKHSNEKFVEEDLDILKSVLVYIVEFVEVSIARKK